MKKCTKCYKLRQSKSFYPNKKTKDKLDSWCRFCRSTYLLAKIQQQKWRDKHKGYIENWKLVNKYSSSKENIKWRKAHPFYWKKEKRDKKKLWARWNFKNHIRYGKIKRQICEVVGCSQIGEGHHADYTKPLDVQWLCKKHHIEHHKKLKQKERKENDRMGIS